MSVAIAVIALFVIICVLIVAYVCLCLMTSSKDADEVERRLFNEKFNKDNLDYNFYQVPYVCYNNMGLRKIDIDMDANRVGDYLLKLTKNNGGLISTFHDVYSKKEEYEQALKLLEYDILSGKQYLYEEDNPYTMQTMKYGLEDMFFTEVKTASDGILVIDGGGFNESCQADLN